LDDQYIPANQRQHDAPIMEHILNGPNHYQPANKKKIHRMRMYLNVFSIADIATADGTAIDKDMFDGNPTRSSN